MTIETVTEGRGPYRLKGFSVPNDNPDAYHDAASDEQPAPEPSSCHVAIMPLTASTDFPTTLPTILGIVEPRSLPTEPLATTPSAVVVVLLSNMPGRSNSHLPQADVLRLPPTNLPDVLNAAVGRVSKRSAKMPTSTVEVSLTRRLDLMSE
jgi:hypothetical protein